MQNFTKWLFSEAGAGWVFGFVSLAALVVAVFNRKKPNRLVVNEVRKIKLANVKKQVGGKVKITYDSKPVEDLGQLEFEIFNEGTNTIKEPEISCFLSENTQILDTSIISSTGNFPSENHTDGHKTTIKFPYVNPYREHRHVIKLLINFNGQAEITRFEGTGEGWSVRHKPSWTSRQEQRAMIVGMASVFVSGVGSLLLTELAERFWGLSADTFNLFNLLLTSPMIITFIIFLTIIVRSVRPKERFRLNEDSNGQS